MERGIYQALGYQRYDCRKCTLLSDDEMGLFQATVASFELVCCRRPQTVDLQQNMGIIGVLDSF